MLEFSDYKDYSEEATKNFLKSSIAQVKRALNLNQRCCYVSATGTGKSQMTKVVLQRMRECGNDLSSFLYVAPSLDSANSLFNSDGFKNFDVLDYDKKAGRLDKVLMTYLKLYNMSQNDEFSEMSIKRDIKYIVFDEAHQAGAKEWQKGVIGLIKAYPNAFVIGLSPVELRPNCGESEYSRNYIGNLFDGNIIRGIGIDDAVNQNILPRPYFITCYVDKEHLVNSVNNAISSFTDNRATKGNTELYLRKNSDLVCKALLQSNFDEVRDKYDWDSVDNNGRVRHLCFLVHSLNIESCERDAEALADVVKKSFNIQNNDINIILYNSDTISSMEDKINIQKDIFNLDKRVTIVAGVNMLNASIHWNCIDAQFVFRHTEAIMQSLQIVGRQMSLFYSKQPIIFDIAEMFNYDHALQVLQERSSDSSASSKNARGSVGRFPVDLALRQYSGLIKSADSKSYDDVFVKYINEVASMTKLVSQNVRKKILVRWYSTQSSRRNRQLMKKFAEEFNLDVSVINSIVSSWDSVMKVV